MKRQKRTQRPQRSLRPNRDGAEDRRLVVVQPEWATQPKQVGHGAAQTAPLVVALVVVAVWGIGLLASVWYPEIKPAVDQWFSQLVVPVLVGLGIRLRWG